MKRIFLSIFTLVMLSLTATSLSAQGFGGGCAEKGMGMGMGNHKPFLHLDMLQYRLSLTNEQVDKLYKIDKDYMDRFYQNRNSADKLKDLRDKHDRDIESILNADQKAKWNEFKKSCPMIQDGKKGMMMHKRGEGPGMNCGMPGGHHAMFQKELGLSNEQIDKIHKIRISYMDSFYQNRNSYDKVKELQKKQDSEIDAVLTTEQKTKLNELRKNRPMMDKKPRDGKGRRGKHYNKHDVDNDK